VECKLLKFNEDGICIGEIVNVSAEESILTPDGKIDAKKLNPISYDSSCHLYWTIGEPCGRAFAEGKKLFGGEGQ
jgi:flavin reductase (DIM6/NTAB) family NADH-FMN oxidoreductase RutF